MLADVDVGGHQVFDTSVAARLTAAGRRTVTLHLSSKQLGRLHSALHAHKKVVAEITAAGLDPTGRFALGVMPSKRLKISG